jgi:hypothetical protein
MVRRFPRLLLLHLLAVAWGAFVALSGRVCPLTPLENLLRARAGQAGYQESFIEHYLVPVVYPAGLTLRAQAGLGIVVLVLNGLAYAWLWTGRRR